MKIIMAFILLNITFAADDLSQLVLIEIKKELAKKYDMNTAQTVTNNAQMISPIEKQLAKNQAKLRLKNNNLGQGESIIAQKLAANRAKIKAMRNKKKVSKTPVNQLEQLKKRANQNLINLKKIERKSLNKWQKEQAAFLKQLPMIKENLIEIPQDKKQQISTIEKKQLISKKIKLNDKTIPHSFESKIKHQGGRPTCSAFAGIKAVEILALEQGRKVDLSEQYFYWASKNECQKRNCANRGSWVASGFRFSKNKQKKDIPLESNCPYNNNDQKMNQTQRPLAQSCSKGKARVSGFSRLTTIPELYQKLEQNKPVIVGLKLSQNFLLNKGYVFLSDAQGLAQNNEHALGHAVTIVGHMSLPEQLHASEGRLCFIVANSWGRGWGKGGYSCLSEKWLARYRNRNPFISVDSIQI